MRTKRQQRRRASAAVPAVEARPDLFGEAWPDLVLDEEQAQYEEENACPCCEDRYWERELSKIARQFAIEFGKEEPR